VETTGQLQVALCQKVTQFINNYNTAWLALPHSILFVCGGMFCLFYITLIPSQQWQKSRWNMWRSHLIYSWDTTRVQNCLTKLLLNFKMLLRMLKNSPLSETQRFIIMFTKDLYQSSPVHHHIPPPLRFTFILHQAICYFKVSWLQFCMHF
jgi:hypothetical protein